MVIIGSSLKGFGNCLDAAGAAARRARIDVRELSVLNGLESDNLAGTSRPAGNCARDNMLKLIKQN